MEWLSLVLFALVLLALMIGFPVAFSLAGVSLLFAMGALLLGVFDMAFINAIPSRIYSIMTNSTLLAVPLFIFMGLMLEKSKIADQLLLTLAEVFKGVRGGLGIAVILVGALLAASTGLVGATVVMLGLLALPTMMQQGYCPKLASGTICASGTLGQIIPPSIVLILLADVISNAYQQAQLQQGIFAPETVSVGDLFAGALIPGLVLVGLYLAYMVGVAFFQPHRVPKFSPQDTPNTPNPQNATDLQPGLVVKVIKSLLPPVALILLVLGSIILGVATPTEAGALGALGALLLALTKRQLNLDTLRYVMGNTLKLTSMIFLIFIGAAFFSLVFRGLGGDMLVHDLLSALPGGLFTLMLLTMLFLFILGFFLDFIEITYVVVPIIAPILLLLGADPIWLAIMIAINLQTAFLTPPFGFALFYLRGVASDALKTSDIYKGVWPFILIQLGLLALLAAWPNLTTWLPGILQ
ncbi:TRAP transporter large permease subunit [Thiomicrospira sp. R3]|uniref:TRAP transporter large permease n=1 Tax=Thiomicrospira sp. R3 TaxID=3035472 RepID=UPI00259B017A|nr:TRAP transporter large permease subunit [Thiomicrospira sp. R3]WFE69242.1 TRAP transporter large permease subunit [Thiomicrospira sp. R3]